jgi:hypothetical protein
MKAGHTCSQFLRKATCNVEYGINCQHSGSCGCTEQKDRQTEVKPKLIIIFINTTWTLIFSIFQTLKHDSD